MAKTYATLDFNGETIEENADIAAFDSEADAAAYLTRAFEDGLDDGEHIAIGEGQFSDCWIKTRHNLRVGDPILGPFSYNQVTILGPGQHPGGNCYWLTPRPDVLVVRIEKEEQS